MLRRIVGGGGAGTWISGLGVTAATVAAIQISEWAGFQVYIPGPLIILAVLFAALRGGAWVGLASAGLAMAWGLAEFSEPGRLFAYSVANVQRLLTLGFVLPVVVGMVAWMRGRGLANEARLREADSLFRGLFDHSIDLLFVHRAVGPDDFPLETWNAAAGEVLRTPLEAVVGRNIEFLLHPSLREQVHQELAASYREGVARSYLLQAQDERSHRSWQLTVVPLRNEAGAIDRMFVSARDVTELKAAEIAASQAAAIKAEFLANMSHEIRTPLNTIVGFSDLLRERELAPAEARYARLVNSASHALLAIVNDVLDFSKLDAGAVTLEPGRFDVDRVAHEVVELFEGQAADRGLRLDLQMEGDPLPPLTADAGRIRQILLNLLSNALKFTEQGGVTLTVTRGRLGSVANVRFAVADTGIGIAPDKLGRLFQRFTQLDGANSRRFGGTGLGLAISRRLAEAMEGSLTVESQAGVGSTFTLDLTLGLAEPDAAVAPSQPPVPGRPCRILVVDDVDVNRELVTAFLKSTPHALVEAASGAAAIEAVQSQPFDLVLMDIQMPGLTGDEATRAIRALGGPLAELPILAMTANALPEQVASYLAAGMNGHLAKPILKGALLQAIDAYASGGGEPAARSAPAAAIDAIPADQAAELLAMFDGQLATRLAGADDDRDAIRADAHALAGSSGMVGFAALGETCRRLEEACRSGDDYAALLAAARADIGAARAQIASKRAA